MLKNKCDGREAAWKGCVYLKNKGIKEGLRDDYQYEISDYRRWKDRSYG